MSKNKRVSKPKVFDEVEKTFKVPNKRLRRKINVLLDDLNWEELERLNEFNN